MGSQTPPTFRPELVPLWAKAAAWAVVASVVPSVLWRLQMSVGALASGDHPCANPASTPPLEWVYIIGLLPVAQLGLALLTFGLIRPWGEVLPRWAPAVGGRRVPVALAAGLAAAGALAVAAFVVFAAAGRPPSRELPAGCAPPGAEVLAFYAPMALWPPLLLALAWHYVRRRRLQLSSSRGKTSSRTTRRIAA